MIPLPTKTPVSSTPVKRTFRWLLNGLTALSLVIALGVAGSWARSYWAYDTIGFTYNGRSHLFLEGFTGRIDFGLGKFDYRPLKDKRHFYYTSDEMPGWDREFFTDYRVWSFSIPHPYFLVFFSLLPAICIYRHYRRRSQFLPGHCGKCGYDLRATPKRCPECGTVAAGMVV